jgi:hypothetical protein
MQSTNAKVIPVVNLTEFFRDQLHTALARQRAAVEDQTEHYVVNLLTLYARSDELHAGMPPGRRLCPLATLLAAAVDAPTSVEREAALQKLGDVSLFVAGFFAHGFERRLVDVDYHVAMGGGAYSTLADRLAHGRRSTLSNVFAELAGKFQLLVDALGEIADSARSWSQRDVLRLYEIWLKTGSARAQRVLRNLGVEATPVALHAH